MHSPFSLFLKPLKSLIAYEEILRLFRAKCNLQFPYRQSPRSDYGLSIAHRNPEFYIINGAISLRKVYSQAYFPGNCIYLSTIRRLESVRSRFPGLIRVSSGLKTLILSRSLFSPPDFSWSGAFSPPLLPRRYSLWWRYPRVP